MKITATKSTKKNEIVYPILMIRGNCKDFPELEGEIYLIWGKQNNGYEGTIVNSPKENRIGLSCNWNSEAMEIYHGMVTLEN